MSERLSTTSPSIASGEMYCIVPMVIPVDVNEVDSPAALAMPKSASFTDSICEAPWVSSMPTRMFAGFTSRWVTRCLRQA